MKMVQRDPLNRSALQSLRAFVEKELAERRHWMDTYMHIPVDIRVRQDQLSL